MNTNKVGSVALAALWYLLLAMLFFKLFVDLLPILSAVYQPGEPQAVTVLRLVIVVLLSLGMALVTEFFVVLSLIWLLSAWGIELKAIGKSGQPQEPIELHE